MFLKKYMFYIYLCVWCSLSCEDDGAVIVGLSISIWLSLTLPSLPLGWSVCSKYSIF